MKTFWESTRRAEEATTLSGEEACFAVDEDDMPIGSFQILIAFHDPASRHKYVF